MNTLQKTAAPDWDEIKESIRGGWEKAKGAIGQGGEDSFLNQYGTELGTGLAGAAIGGGLYGMTASRRPYENEEEFERRRVRGALTTAALTGSLAGLYKPATEFWNGEGRFAPKDPGEDGAGGITDGGLEGFRERRNRKIERENALTNPDLAFGDLNERDFRAKGFVPTKEEMEKYFTPDWEAEKPGWMQRAELANQATKPILSAGGAIVGSKTVGNMVGPTATELEARGQAKVDLEKLRSTAPDRATASEQAKRRGRGLGPKTMSGTPDIARRLVTEEHPKNVNHRKYMQNTHVKGKSGVPYRPGKYLHATRWNDGWRGATKKFTGKAGGGILGGLLGWGGGGLIGKHIVEPMMTPDRFKGAPKGPSASNLARP